MSPSPEIESPSAEEPPRPLPGPERSNPFTEYGLVLGVVAFITVAGWFVPASHYPLGFVYLLAVVGLSIRVGKGPVFFAAVASALAWNFVFMPPRLAFSALQIDTAIMLATYFLVALIAGQLTARLRAQERFERLREQRARTLLQLSRALDSAGGEDDAAHAALLQASRAFPGDAALYLFDDDGRLGAARNGRLALEPAACRALEEARASSFAATAAIHGTALLVIEPIPGEPPIGVLAIQRPERGRQPVDRALLHSFAAEIAAALNRRRARAAKEREKLLLESDRLHRTLLDSVSHELKTPLSVLRTAVEKLQRTDDARRRGDLVSEIHTATQRLHRLVGNLLNQTRLEAGAIKPQLDWCDVRDVISVARRELAEPLAPHPLALKIPEEMPLLFADAGLMEHVVGNLLLNAAVHTPAGTPIELTAGKTGDGRRVYLRVSDRGPGISPEVQQSLFGKFQRGRAAVSGGLGLGLSIVHGFMLAQGGSVEAGNGDDGGAVFTVYLPHASPGSLPPE
ncbi:histidine kinase [Opitutaceae bacterium EW11]|nr:histidine kinase [Opitutaceae bacterium EW11]